jgi:hypothetical protein
MVLLLAGGEAQAESWHTSKIKNVYPLGDGSFVLIFVDSAAACSNQGKYHYVSAGAYGVNAEGVKMMMSTALMAHATDKTISIAFDESSPSCYINRFSTVE